MNTNAAEIPIETGAWAQEEYGDAQLGSKRRTDRLVQMAARGAHRPSGIVSEVFNDSAELEGAYRFVRNPHVDHVEIGAAAHRATARRASGAPFVFVPVDGSNITVPWAAGTEAFGPVGTSSQCVRGVEVMSAIAVHPNGTPLGLCGQQWWVRFDRGAKKKPKSHKPRPLHKKETQHWLKCIQQTERAFSVENDGVRRWYQCDAGADFREMLRWMAETDQLATVRAAQDRRLDPSDDDYIRYLWEYVTATDILGTYEFEVPEGRKRQARTARIEVRATAVPIRLYDSWNKKADSVSLTAVLAREAATAPQDEDPIEWLLLTNAAVTSFEDAVQVIQGYGLRWRIEAFHRTWKSGCNVEDTLMEDPAHLIVWATILAGVAMRIERLTHLARQQPELPATEELTKTEIDAIIVLRKPKNQQRGDFVTIGEAVQWIAELGGYRGKSSGGPPGTVVIGRGLRDVAIAAQVLRNLDPSPS